MHIFGTFTKLRPLSFLQHLARSHDSTCVQVLSNSIIWLIFLENGKITYLNHSVEPFDRLERHLRRLSSQIPLLDNQIRTQMRMMFETEAEPVPTTPFSEAEFPPLNQHPPEYQAICWLVSERHLNPTQAAILIQELVKEVLESLLLITEGKYRLVSPSEKLPIICRIDTEKIIDICQKKNHAWQSFAPYITSPYQRPYLRVPELTNQTNSPQIQQNLAVWMKGFSLRHLAVIMNQEEMQMVRNLIPYILNGEIVLHEPDPPFDLLPKIPQPQPQTTPGETASVPASTASVTENSTSPSLISTPVRYAKREADRLSLLNETAINPLPQETSNYIPQPQPDPVQSNSAPPTNSSSKKTYKIVSVDDSPTVLREISRFLEQENFAVVAINDPVKAVMSIIRNKPDLILLDLNMDGIDGYELCRIIRNNSMFKKIPIIMVTGNKSLIDKVKARLVGASGYLTKPFTRAELLKIVFMHLA